jgi:hypothetical protein
MAPLWSAEQGKEIQIVCIVTYTEEFWGMMCNCIAIAVWPYTYTQDTHEQYAGKALASRLKNDKILVWYLEVEMWKTWYMRCYPKIQGI